jgi:hypothetical protein
MVRYGVEITNLGEYADPGVVVCLMSAPGCSPMKASRPSCT